MNNFYEKDWTFLNAGSPADLWADYRPDGSVHVKEYGRYRDGHFLVSRFFVDTDEAEIVVRVDRADGGAAAGFYYGKGGFCDFIRVIAVPGRISVQIPRGIPMGDSFRSEGAERMKEIAGTEWESDFPASLRFRKNGRICSVSVNGRKYLECMIPENVETGRWCRILLGAVNSGKYPAEETVFGQWNAFGIQEFPPVSAFLKDKNGQPLAGYTLHLCGSADNWTRTEEDGRFVLRNVPPGSYDAIAGREGEDYLRVKITSTGKEICAGEARKEADRKRELQTEIDAETTKIDLSGVWKFDWDREEKGRREGWFLPGKHDFSKVIKVPFSFHSLEAFGEGFLAEDWNLHQAASWYVNLRETGETVWYQRSVTVTETGEWDLVVGAVSGFSRIWINGVQAGCTMDSYERFRFPAGSLTAGEKTVITIEVKYPADHVQSCRGKQDFWFHASPGIWQDIWMEKVPEYRADEILADCSYTEKGTEIKGDIYWCPAGGPGFELFPEKTGSGEVRYGSERALAGVFRVTVQYEADRTERIALFAGGRELCRTEWDATGESGYFDRKILYVRLEGERSLRLSGWEHDFKIRKVEIEDVTIPENTTVRIAGREWTGSAVLHEDGTMSSSFHFRKLQIRPWKPEDPQLFTIAAWAQSGRGKTCVFERKAGARKVGAGRYFQLNGEDVYIRGVLDQGYNPWGLYTYPAVRGGKGSMQYDIRKAKEYGYNLIRMHIKDNEPTWYQLCDEEGMLVWDEHPGNFYGKWDDPIWRSMYYRRLKRMIRKQNYHPCIVIYSVFNESWGIMGGHELSAWDSEGGQKWQKAMAGYFRENGKQVLMVDNSGYAKTGLSDILDYHIYPDEFDDAQRLFGRLEKENFPGSCFNCFNARNKELMKDADRRELLQRNCRMDLADLEYKGNEVQHGQPVFLSEFVHTGRLEMMVRKYPGIAGYIRMNLSSQENEDTSPMSATRRERDFGYRHVDFSPAGYSYVNGIHLVWPDIPPLTKRRSGEMVKIPVLTRMWEKEGRELELAVWESRTGLNGTETPPVPIGEYRFSSIAKEPVVTETEYQVPEKVRAVQLFFTVCCRGEILAENDVRFEVFDGDVDRDGGKTAYFKISEPEHVDAAGEYGNLCEETGRDGFFLSGKGTAAWKVPFESGAGEEETSWILRMELSTCECVGGTRITDEQKYSGRIWIRLNGRRTEEIVLEDSPWDEKAVFSNSACGPEKTGPWKKTGRYGYGYQTDIPLTPEEVKTAEETGFLTMEIESEETGAVIYGRRMGRYGTEPIIIRKEHTNYDFRQTCIKSQTGLLQRRMD